MGGFRTFGFGVVAVAAILAGGIAEAQTRTLRNTQGPAETPPGSFAGTQYVDSRGCVFIRAGVNGVTRWVPRVNRDRSVVCGAA
ncbi:MAG: SPOR domain-containing protein, partial [Jannaschia sp.]